MTIEIPQQKFGFLRNKFCNSLIAIFLFFNTIYVEFFGLNEYLYKQFPIIQQIVNITHYNIAHIASLLLEYKVEPFIKTWIYAGHLFADKKKIQLWEYYDYYSKNKEDENEYMMNLIGVNHNILKDSDSEYLLLIVKYKNNTVVRSEFLDVNKDNYTPLLECNTSEKPFIQVSYTHPKLEHQIDMNLDDSYYLENNELYSCAFVKRWLEYQEKEYVFDLDYEIKILDTNINEIKLDYNSYIVLKDDNYEVKSIKK
tara:strand:+ start:4227 stop:4991 length:765 start_codon:yes stop_codon:yes gene_type:complete